MNLRDRILSTVSRLTPGERDAFSWMIAGLVVAGAMACVGLIIRLEWALR